MSATPQSCRLIERYHQTLRERPQATAFIWVDKNANQTIAYTYEELDRAARGLAQKLTSEGIRKGDTVLLAYGPGFDFFIAFWGCLISGIVAAPVTPPISSKDVDKFIKLYRHCDGRMILTDKRFARLLKAKAYKEKISDVGRGVRSLLGGAKNNSRASAYSALIEERWLTTSGLPIPAQPESFTPQPPDATAFIMYSSGSTSAPKGALTTFGNLSHQLEMNGQALDCSPDHVSCWWAPHYHDYGLISGFLNVIYQGCKGVLASPFDFIQHPPLWLDMLHKYGGTHTFGPDFGYDLLIRKTRQADREADKWNLSPLKVAMSAAEKVRAATIDAFSTAFAPCGFRREVFCPAYGLAEHTVGVTINGVRTEPVVQRFLRKPLEEDGIALNADAEDDFDANDERIIELVGNGIARFETDLQVVKLDRDGDPLDVMPHGQVGEVWVASESKTIGYFKEVALTETAFHARLPDGTRPTTHYLRTGDLGFISKENGELFICGRQKDMIILAGKNHYSEDLEVTLSNHTREFLRPGRIAAFSFEEKGSAAERLGIVAEVRNDEIDRTQAFHVIKTCLASEHKISVSTIALIKSGSIPKTSSGKLRRFEARERLLDNTLDIINHGIWTAPVKDFDAAPSYEETLAMLINTVERLQASDGHVDALTHIPSLKLTPLALAQLEDAIRQDHPHVEFQLEMMARHATPKDLAAFLVQEDDTSKAKAVEPMPTLGAHPSTTSDRISTVLHPLLYAQERALNEVRGPLDEPRLLSISGWLQGEVSIAALRRALDWLTERHTVLRTTFEQGKDGSYGQFVQTEW
ncbi:MAG: AMP-binding protein, partial [Myxococcota bacterium]|nr:AMP-binding protein [Myxococcota bacterium]